MWPETKEVGCAVVTCEDNGKQVITCQYSSASRPYDTPLFTEEALKEFNLKTGDPLEKCYSQLVSHFDIHVLYFILVTERTPTIIPVPVTTEPTNIPSDQSLKSMSP